MQEAEEVVNSTFFELLISLVETLCLLEVNDCLFEGITSFSEITEILRQFYIGNPNLVVNIKSIFLRQIRSSNFKMHSRSVQFWQIGQLAHRSKSIST